jgi:multiphosphoryl transfer protein
MSTLTLSTPLAGWSGPLDEAPDEVFATRMLGDGVAIDPVAGTLHAPCDGELVQVAAARHAVTVRAAGGCDILLHVGIDTVNLAGEGFEVHAQPGARVRTGEALLSFDLDRLARRARSLLTPVIVTAESGFRIVRRTLDREVAVGEFLMELAPEAHRAAAGAAGRAPAGDVLVRSARVGLEHGIHARPAAALGAALKSLAADVRILARGREANARSAVGLMALAVQRGERIELRASGPDAAAALDALEAALVAVRGAPAAALRAPLAGAGAARPSASDGGAPAGHLPGLIASRGLAVGRALHLRRPEVTVAETGSGASAEEGALERARATVRARLERRADPSAGGLPEAAREIAGAHLGLLDDPQLLAAARALISQGKGAGFAWRGALRSAAATLGALEDARLRERADDLLDLESEVLLALKGGIAPGAPELAPESIVIARELLPSQLVALDATRLAGICLAGGGATSHVAIIAAAMGIPALVALGPEVLALPDGAELVLDAERGVLETEPGAPRLAAARTELAARRARLAASQAAAQRDCRTADGQRIEVFANIGSLAEARAAVRNGAEGCGLLCTEFLFLDRDSPPDESEQAAAYQGIAEALGARPLTIRTLDAGGDKPLPYLPQPPETNPALGLRGVRTSLAEPALLATQLRAILAVRGAAPCRILLPMITDAAEVLAVRALLDEIRGAPGRAAPVELGVMIETPAAALLAERLAVVADFLSIGTNDLTQYTLAMDRGHPQLAPRLDALHPAVLRLIREVAAAGHARGRAVAVCGGLASEPLAAPLLVGLGVSELSAVGAVIPALKARIGSVTLAQCRTLAEQALAAEDAAAVRALAQRGLPPVPGAAP